MPYLKWMEGFLPGCSALAREAAEGGGSCAAGAGAAGLGGAAAAAAAAGAGAAAPAVASVSSVNRAVPTSTLSFKAAWKALSTPACGERTSTLT